MDLHQLWVIWLAVSIPVGMAVLAVGAVLAIKILRRRQATKYGQSEQVPAAPWSASDARQMWLRYAAVGGAMLGLMGVSALIASH